jgi:tetratricopeptide (TPR) repeat protein
MLFYPHPLSYDYSFNEIPATTFGNWKVILTILSIVVLIYIAIRDFKKKSIISFGILFFFITIALVSNIFMLIGATMADRFLFTPSLGFCLIVAYLFTKLFKSDIKIPFASFKTLAVKNSRLLILIIAILGLYSFKTITRNKDWKNNFTLFEKDVDAAPNSSRTQYNYGTGFLGLYNNASDQDTTRRNALLNTCISHLETSVKLDSNAHQSYLNLASAYYQKKDYRKTIWNAQQNLRVTKGTEAKAHSLLGNAYYRLNQFDDAIEQLNIAIKSNFFSDDTYIFLGGSYFGKRDFKNAIEAFNKAIELKPNNIDAYTNLGAAYGSINDFNDAIKTFKTSLTYNPANAQTYYYIALTFNNMGAKDSAQVYLAKYNALLNRH